MIVLKMAWRNVWRNHRRSSITIAAMTLALVVELLYSGLATGLMRSMEEDITGYDLGDLQIFAPGYPTRPSLYNTVKNSRALLRSLDAAGYVATARLHGGGLAACGDLSAGVSFIGVDPQRDAQTLALSTAIAEGHWLDNSDPKGIVVGRGLARTLALKVGSEVVLLSQAADGSVANDLFVVRGILLSVAAATDRSTILLTEQAFRQLMVFPEGAHRIIIRKPRDIPIEQAVRQVRELAARAAPSPNEGGSARTPHRSAYEVTSWKQLSPVLSQWLQSVSTAIIFVYLIVYVAVAILILNSMLMAVFERIREFGVLKAIGYGPRHVLGMMVAEGLLQAVVALGVGLLLALPGMWYLQTQGVDVGVLGGMQMGGMTMPTVWHGSYDLSTVQVPVFMLIVIVLMAVLYPALKAAWISPLAAMHHQ